MIRRPPLLWCLPSLLALCGAGRVLAAPGCEPGRFVVAVDVGHSRASPGAVSARGVGEYTFNLALARELHRQLQQRGFSASFVIDESGADLDLSERAARAQAGHAELLVSVHHDSVQPRYLETWRHAGEARRYSDRFRGYSLFYSADNPQPQASLAFARAVGTELRRRGFTPTLHHAEPIPGESRVLVDADAGVYRFDELALLRSAAMPALLLEAGVIVNREEELQFSEPEYRRRLSGAVADAIAATACNAPR